VALGRRAVAVLRALESAPHSSAEQVFALITDDLPGTSPQAVYMVLNDLARAGLIRKFEPAGSAALYERRTRDNHHHLVCRDCAAVVDIDGGARVEATRPAANRPTLLLGSVDDSVQRDNELGVFAARSPNTVSVGVTKALHMDLTDAALMPQLLGDSVFTPLLGQAGARGPATTATIVRRFLAATLASQPRMPSATELVAGLAGTTATPYG